MINLRSLLARVKQERDGPVMDECRCTVCHKDFAVADCIHDYGHHDGWEMPPYTEIQCPECECGGCIEDFWSSEKAIIEHGEYLREHKPCQFEEYKTYFPDVYCKTLTVVKSRVESEPRELVHLDYEIDEPVALHAIDVEEELTRILEVRNGTQKG